MTTVGVKNAAPACDSGVHIKNRGFSGRVAIVEMMPFTSGLRDLMARNQPAIELRRLALEEGMKTLRQSGLQKALEGTTTLEEVLRVCLRDE